MKILIAEDEEILLNSLVRALTRAGYDVCPAKDGSEAIEMIDSQSPFDLLLTDFEMPGAHGVDVALKFHQNNPQSPLCILSGNLSQDDRIDADKKLTLKGIQVTFFEKPMPRKEILAWVSQQKTSSS